MAKRDTLDIEEVAAGLGISRNAAYAAVKNGQIPALRLGRRIVVPKAAYERLLKAEPKAA